MSQRHAPGCSSNCCPGAGCTLFGDNFSGASLDPDNWAGNLDGWGIQSGGGAAGTTSGLVVDIIQPWGTTWHPYSVKVAMKCQSGGGGNQQGIVFNFAGPPSALADCNWVFAGVIWPDVVFFQQWATDESGGTIGLVSLTGDAIFQEGHWYLFTLCVFSNKTAFLNWESLSSDGVPKGAVCTQDYPYDPDAVTTSVGIYANGDTDLWFSQFQFLKSFLEDQACAYCGGCAAPTSTCEWCGGTGTTPSEWRVVISGVTVAPNSCPIGTSNDTSNCASLNATFILSETDFSPGNPLPCSWEWPLDLPICAEVSGDSMYFSQGHAWLSVDDSGDGGFVVEVIIDTEETRSPLTPPYPGWGQWKKTFYPPVTCESIVDELLTNLSLSRADSIGCDFSAATCAVTAIA